MAARIGIPIVALAPHLAAQGLLRGAAAAFVYAGIHFHGDCARAPQFAAAAQYMVELAFQHVEDGVVTQVGVRAIQQEEVGKAGNAQTQVRRGPFTPQVVQALATRSANLQARQKVRGIKARAIDEHIRQVHGAVFGLDAIGQYAPNGRRRQRYVRQREGFQVVAGNEHALAADGVVRC